MQVETVTAIGFGLLAAVRDALNSSDDALLCVAFAHERGVRLVAKELDEARRRGARTRLLVTNVFDRGGTTDAALAVARGLWRGSAHPQPRRRDLPPQLYLGSRGDCGARAVFYGCFKEQTDYLFVNRQEAEEILYGKELDLKAENNREMDKLLYGLKSLGAKMVHS